jgi:anoctamin-8
VAFFSSAFPLASLWAFFNNVIEIRTDAFKLCYVLQRPFGERVRSIGTWQVRILNTCNNCSGIRGNLCY